MVFVSKKKKPEKAKTKPCHLFIRFSFQYNYFS